MSSFADLLVNLLNYVVEQSKDIDPNGFKLTGNKEFVKYKPGLQGLPGVDFDKKIEGDHIWMRVERLTEIPPPQIQLKEISRFFSITTNPSGPEPSINESVLAHSIAIDIEKLNNLEGEQLKNSRRQLVTETFARYKPLWKAWAEGEKIRRVTISLYGELFSLKHQMDAEETAKPHELVWGLGITSWKLSVDGRGGASSVDYQYPLITQAMEISIEDQTLAIVLSPRAIDPRFEFDAFSACHVLSAPEVEKACKEALAKNPDKQITPFDVGSYEHLLRLAAGNLHERGQFLTGQDRPLPPVDDLVVTDAWVLLARPRSNNFLLEDIERLKANIRAGATIPVGCLSLVTPPIDQPSSVDPISFRGLSGTSSSGVGGTKPQELYFPLPYNHEQVTIVEQLERSEGITVQGPPGTGKTHTIANIVCHYLATGRKVLVTSKGEQALEVLQSKIPPEVRPLTVALIAGDREGMRQFQSAIETIIHNVSQLNPEVSRTEIVRIISAIDRAHSELATIDKRVDEIALAQLCDVEVDGVTMRAQKMAELVIHGASLHAWFDDSLSLEPAHAPPVSASEVAQVREARRRLGTDLQYARTKIPSSTALLPAAEIELLHNVLVDIREIEEAEAKGGLLPLRSTTPEILDQARGLLVLVEAAASLAQELEQTGEVWTFELRKKCRQSEFVSERKALEALFDEIETLIRARAEFLIKPVELDEAAISLPKVREALLRASETGRPFGLMAFGVSEV